MPTYRGSGTPTAGADLYDQATLDQAVTDAQTAETNAAASATAAALSESNAATSESNAAASASAAATSETNAASSASAAATSASNAATSETNAATSETNAAASYDSFDDRYLGPKASDPTLDNDGDPLLTGALYFNSTNNVMRVYNGSSWADVGSATANITEWTVSGTQTTFTGTDDNGTVLAYTVGYLMVYQNGVLLDPDDYTATTGNSVVLDIAAVAGDTVNIIGFGTFDVSTSYTKTELDNGQLDTRYYTETELDGGALDSLYVNEPASWSTGYVLYDGYVTLTGTSDSVDIVSTVDLNATANVRAFKLHLMAVAVNVSGSPILADGESFDYDCVYDVEHVFRSHHEADSTAANVWKAVSNSKTFADSAYNYIAYLKNSTSGTNNKDFKIWAEHSTNAAIVDGDTVTRLYVRAVLKYVIPKDIA